MINNTIIENHMYNLSDEQMNNYALEYLNLKRKESTDKNKFIINNDDFINYIKKRIEQKLLINKNNKIVKNNFWFNIKFWFRIFKRKVI